MKLWDWISGQLLPLFGDVPMVQLDFGNFGSLSIEQILQVMFWISVGYVAIDVLVILPYYWINKLMRRKGWSK